MLVEFSSVISAVTCAVEVQRYMLRDYDQAFALLERAIAGGGPELVNWVKYDSDLDGLRNDPRYAALLARA